MWSKFEIVSARTIASQKRYIVYCIKVQKEGVENDNQIIFFERRYSDFLELYTSLRQSHPALTERISFPRKVLLGNFSSSVILTRLIGLENFLKVISENNALLDSIGFRTFLVGQEEKLARKFLKIKQYSAAKPLLEKNFKILNKIHTEHHPEVILALCRLAACCTADGACLSDAMKYAEIALRRFEGISDVDLLYYYVPLLQMCTNLWRASGRDKEMLEMELSSLKRLGHKVDGCPSLLETMLAVD